MSKEKSFGNHWVPKGRKELLEWLGLYAHEAWNVEVPKDFESLKEESLFHLYVRLSNNLGVKNAIHKETRSAEAFYQQPEYRIPSENFKRFRGKTPQRR